ncbi:MULTISPECIES: VOC family protein [Bacteroidota]|uniref:VOC domain-containing protein n=2 Tax=Bacteroidota TaxID=976 RepID=A0A101CHR3_9FLAO|nr:MULTISPECIES: VOC family protein [Bacteroidota]KUJ56139.1 hypothetical protein AR686_11105 [Chryseobacterium aquaticum subsp. greenlandense]MBE8722494.1 VOC family protein [Sphingobacterium pedocola]
MMNNIITWFELPVNDFDRARKFYENVLEISLTQMENEGFKSLAFPFDGSNVSGSLVQNLGNGQNNSIMLYFNAGQKLSPALERVKVNNGKIIMETMRIKSGVIAQVLDSEGNKIALFALEA